MDIIEAKMNETGGYGRYQFLVMLLSLIPSTFCAAHMGASIFIALTPEVQCFNPTENFIDEGCNVTSYLVMDNFVEKSGQTKPSYCSRYNFNSTFSCNVTLPENLDVVPCDQWTYDRRVMRSTVVSDFNMVCGDVWGGYLGQSSLMLGVAVGTLASGFVSDKFGRRVAFLVACVGTATFGIVVSFAQSYTSYSILTFFLGLFAYNAFPVLFVFNSELTTKRYRYLVGQILELAFPIGFSLLSLLSYLLREWRHVQLALSIPFLASIILWWFMPESPRWLYGQGREDEAVELILKISHCNRRTSKSSDEEPNPLNPEEHEEREDKEVKISNDDETTVSGFAIFKHRYIRAASLKMFYIWFSVSCVYYGLTLNAAALGDDPFVVLCFNAIAEAAAVLLTMPLVNYAGRRITSFGSEALAGLACIATILTPKHFITPVAILGKFAISISFSTMFIHANEIYATPVRTIGIGACSTMSRIGGVMSPIIALSTSQVRELAYIVFGLLSITAGMIALTLPETKSLRLPQTIQEGEEFIAKDRGIRNCCRKGRGSDGKEVSDPFE